MQTQMNKLNIKFLLLVSIFFNVYQLQADERNTNLNQTTPEDIEARVRRRAQDLNRGREAMRIQGLLDGITRNPCRVPGIKNRGIKKCKAKDNQIIIHFSSVPLF